MKCIVDVIKGNKNFKLSYVGKMAFEDIKDSISKFPMLVYPRYTKELIIYYYGSKHTMSVILMQENK